MKLSKLILILICFEVINLKFCFVLDILIKILQLTNSRKFELTSTIHNQFKSIYESIKSVEEKHWNFMLPFTANLRDAAETIALGIRKFAKNRPQFLEKKNFREFQGTLMKSFEQQSKSFQNFSDSLNAPKQELENFLKNLKLLSFSSFLDLRVAMNPNIDSCLSPKRKQNLQKIVSDGKIFAINCFRNYTNELMKMSRTLGVEILNLNKAAERFMSEFPICGRFENANVAENCAVGLVSVFMWGSR